MSPLSEKVPTNIEFQNQPNPEFEIYDPKSSFKTNLMILSNNWRMLTQYLSNLKAYIVHLANLIDVDTLVQVISENFQNSKASIPILFSMSIGGIINQKINNTNYKIERVSEYIIEISNLTTPAWFVDRLIVQIKDSDGTIVHPVIITKNNRITIHFIDGITTNYNVIFV